MITLQQVQEAVREVVTDHPDQVNPRLRHDGSGGCVYTSTTDPDWHCLAGEVLVRLDVPLPDRAFRVAGADPHHEYFRYDAMNFLGVLQDVADTGGYPRRYALDESYRRDVPWREAYEVACQVQGLTP